MPGRIAWHWAQAQHWSLAAPAYLLAAAQARDAGRVIEQAALLDEAALCFEHAGDAAARFDALLLRAEVLGQFELGEQALASVAAVAAAAGNEAQRLRVLLVQVQSGEMRGESQRTLELAPRGMALARAQGDREIELRFAIPLSGALAEHRRAADAVALLESMTAAANSEGAPDELRWDHAAALALSLDYANRLGDAVPVWRASLELARRMKRNDLAWQSISNLASTHAKMGRVQLAVELSLQARQLARSDGEEMQGRKMQGQMTLAHRLRDLGRYAEAVPLLEEALALFRRNGGSRSDAAAIEHRLAQAFQQLGQPARSQQLLQIDHVQLPLGLAVMRQVHRADLAHQLGGDALTPMRAALALQPDPNDIYHRIATLFASAIVPADEGEALATGLAAWASAHQRQGLALAGHIRAARCALAQDAARRALPHVEAALRLAQDHQPESFYLPELWLVAARVLHALGRAADAEVALRDGLAWVQRVSEQHVPAPFRDSFRQRNPVNRELFALAARAP
jgi:tetratricopeptide (TPR) repeat protein